MYLYDAFPESFAFSIAADPDSGDTVCKIDFTDFNHTGEYYIRIKDTEWRSFPFRIGYDIYSDTENDMLTSALNYFYQSRSGLDIESKYITSGDSRELAHRFNRDEAVGFVRDKWSSEYPTTTEKAENFTATRIDTGGGWFTGSDFDKYMTEGGRAVWILQNMYERFLKEKLTYMGLTEEEMNEFIVYWLPLMEHNKYNLITFQDDAYTNSAKLNITPTPDSLLRIFMAYVPLEEAVDIEQQQLDTFERKGFTVVEWGGSKIQ